MKDIEIAHIKFGESSKGLEVSTIEKEIGYYQFQKGSSMTAVPTNSYCPVCSKTHENKYGKLIPKWSLEIQDLELRLSYGEDENGCLYAKCDICGFDMRKDFDLYSTLDPIIEEEIVKDIFVNGVYYQNGFYWMKTDNFKEGMMKFKEGVKIQLCFIHNNGDVKKMKNEAFKNAKNLQMKGNEIGIKANLWQ
jgi:hypothetical protein